MRSPLVPSLLPVLLVLALLRPSAAQEDTIGALPLSKAANAFAELAEASAQDAGKLWGVEIAGPVLLVDPQSRRLAANQADAQGVQIGRAHV